MDNATCSLAGCDKPIKRGGYCYGHYMKAWRYGTPTPQHAPRWVDLIGRRFGALVVTEDRDGSKWACRCDCGATTAVRAGDLNRGGVTSCGNRSTHHRRDDIGYGMAHERVRADRGRVQLHDCIDCGNEAQQWSYDHADPDEMHAHHLSANPIAYSNNPEHYSPRCVKCHKRFDLDRIDAFRVS